MKKSWILVADSARARIFTTKSPTAPLEELKDLTHIAAKIHDQQLVTDLPGRHSNDTGIGAHNYEPKVLPTEEEAIMFAKELAKELKQGFDHHEFEQLYLVAPAHFLGLLKKELDSKIARIVAHTEAKDVAKMSAEEIRKRLPEYLPQL